MNKTQAARNVLNRQLELFDALRALEISLGFEPTGLDELVSGTCADLGEDATDDDANFLLSQINEE